MSHFRLYAFCQTVLMIKLTAVARYSESCENLICVMASLAYLNGSVSSSCRFRASSILTTPFVKPTAVMKINHLLYHYPGLYIQGVYWHIVDWLFLCCSCLLWHNEHTTLIWKTREELPISYISRIVSICSHCPYSYVYPFQLQTHTYKISFGIYIHTLYHCSSLKFPARYNHTILIIPNL